MGVSARQIPSYTLNYKAYKPEQPVYNRSSDASTANNTSGALVDKTSGFAPVNVSQTSAEANDGLQLRVNNNKQVWGKESGPDAAPDAKPSTDAAGASTTNT